MAALTKTGNNPNSAIAELFSTGGSNEALVKRENDAVTMTDLLVELLGTRCKI